jgi:hypothetical protein
MKVDPTKSISLVCTYWGSDAWNRDFDILIDSTKIASQQLDNNDPGKLFDVSYPIDPELISGKTSVTVTFQAKQGKIAGGLFGCRMVMH